MARKNDFISKLDKYVGTRMYDLRLARGFSRAQVAEVIEVTHQQYQKYEKGTNRITIGRLALIARALDKPINYFYEGFENASLEEEKPTQHQRMCLEVSKNFMRIENKKHQETLHELAKNLAQLAKDVA